MREVGTQTDAVEVGTQTDAVEQPAAARYPLQGWRWLRMVLLTAICMICAGVLAGSAQWVPILADAGVGGSQCPDGSASTCDKQVVFIAGAFSAAASVCMFNQLFVGLLFDRFGANFSGTFGALFVCLGMLILQIPLVGAQYGYDAQTSGFLVWGLVVIDVACTLNNYCLLGLLYHFPDHQTSLTGFMTASIAAPALYPMFTIAVQDWTGLPLHLLFFGWLGLAVLACIGCRLLAPTLEEYDEQAQKVLGYPPPRAGKASFFLLLKDANGVLRCNWIRHLFFALCLSLVNNIGISFGNLSSTYGSQLFHSKKAGGELAQLCTITMGLGGVFFAPAVSYISDRFRHAMRFLVALMALLLTACAFCIGKPTWSAVEVTGISCTMMATVMNSILIPKYFFAFATASRVGCVIGLFYLYQSIPAMIALAGTFTWISSSPEDLTTPLQVAAWIAAGSFLAWGAYMFYAGLPTAAVVLPKDEEHLATAFGCTSFEELVRKTGLQGRDEVIKMLSDPQSLQSLVQSADEEEEARRRATAAAAAEREWVPATWAPPQAAPREASWTIGFGFSGIFALPCCVARDKPEDNGYLDDDYLKPLLDTGPQQNIFDAARPRELP